MQMRTVGAVLVGAALWVSAAEAQVRLAMADGQVTLSASNATVAQILAEWARVGQARIVNAERLTGAPLTLELKDVPEAQALDILLRNAGGYLLAPRAEASATLSRFDRILVLPPSTAPRAAAPAAQPAPSFQARPAPQQPFENNAGSDQERAINRFPGAAQPNAQPPQPAFTPQGAAPPVNGNAPAVAPAPATVNPAFPGAPFGVARPGMMVPVPQQPQPQSPPPNQQP